MRRKITYMYWQNPFDPENEEWVEENVAKGYDKDKPWEPEDSREREPHKVRPVLLTPSGYIPLSPYYDFNKRFEFWMGHTNFDIDDDVADAIEKTPGVVILDIVNRYEFRFAVGRLFKGAEVKAAICETLHAVPPRKGEINPLDIRLPKEIRDKLDTLEKYTREYEMWTVYVLPNGEIDLAVSNDKTEFDHKLQIHKGAQELAGGVIITNDSK